jgi:hypothetical protein
MKISAHIINAILRRDAKDATYKFALLRALVQTITEQNAHQRLVANPSISDLIGNNSEGKTPMSHHPVVFRYPLGLLVWFWLQYYYPIFSSEVFIPQKNGESPDREPGKTLAIRPLFESVSRFYKEIGGFPQFYFDLLHDTIPGEIRSDVRALLRKIQDTIVKMPMRHMGFSTFGVDYALVNASKGTIRGLSYGSLIQESGCLYVHPELHDAIDELGGLLIGDDSIVAGWAGFTSNLSRRTQGTNKYSEAEIMELLRVDLLGDRDVFLAHRILQKHPQLCVWTGNKTASIHIDHVLPYSVTRSNSLWNLVPVTPMVNLRKSDRIPTAELLVKSEPRITQVWKTFEREYESLFWYEVYQGLGIAKEQGLSGALDSLTHRSEYLINTRGFDSFGG